MTIENLPHRKNNFNLIRFCAAAAVVVSHSFSLCNGPGPKEPLYDALGFSLGIAAVYVFFAISGFFIAKSFDSRTSNIDFIVARALRIFPGLLAAGLFAAFVIGPLFTSHSLSDYLSNSATWTYTPLSLSMVWWRDSLPGVFEENPISRQVNGPLWTLYYEAFCYASLFVLGCMRLLRTATFPVTFVVYLLAYVYAVNSGRAYFYALLSLPFMIGVGLYLYRHLLPVRGYICAALLSMSSLAIMLELEIRELFVVTLSYCSLWLGFANIPFLGLYNRLGDYSYGIYIYGYPLQQALAASTPGIEPLAMSILALAASAFLAATSWHLIERPALLWRRRLETMINRIAPLE